MFATRSIVDTEMFGDDRVQNPYCLPKQELRTNYRTGLSLAG